MAVASPVVVSTRRAEAAWRMPIANVLDGSTAAVTVVLVVVGILCVDTAVTPQAVGQSIYTFMARYVILGAVGVGLFLLARRANLSRWASAATPALAVSLGLLVLVRVAGEVTSGGRRWLALGPISFEPSELFTLMSCFYLATVIARAERTKRQWIDVLVRCAPVVVGAVLIMIEPDYGTGAVLLLVTFGTLVLAGMPRKLITSMCLAAGACVGGGALVARYRLARVEALFGHGPASATYQVLQAKIALGSGKLSGLGFGQSRAKWGLLPNPHTDFIFAIVGEQFGFIGALALLGLFLWLLTLGARVARRAPDRESQLLAGAITLWFGIELVVNVGSVEGVWPVTGIPLPLVSYGGTSLVIDLVALGLLCNVARRSGSRANPALVTPLSAARRGPGRPQHPSARSG